MTSKRSNFITRLAADKKQTLIMRLLYLAEVLYISSSVMSLIVLTASVNFLEYVCPFKNIYHTMLYKGGLHSQNIA